MDGTEGGDLSIEELKDLLREKDTLIKALEARVTVLETQNQQITEQFATSRDWREKRKPRQGSVLRQPLSWRRVDSTSASMRVPFWTHPMQITSLSAVIEVEILENLPNATAAARCLESTN